MSANFTNPLDGHLVQPGALMLAGYRIRPFCLDGHKLTTKKPASLQPIHLINIPTGIITEAKWLFLTIGEFGAKLVSVGPEDIS